MSFFFLAQLLFPKQFSYIFPWNYSRFSMKWLSGNTVFELLFPRLCSCCGNRLLQSESCICSYCIFHFPKTHYHLLPDNPVEEIFWGRVKLKSATAFLFFSKGSQYQKLIHQLKYQRGTDVGRILGQHLGSDLSNSRRFFNIDYIIPVPLHPNKEKKRGYNQSLIIAEGMSLSMRKPILDGNLYRKLENPTQTRKNRFQRWKNVEGIFDVRNATELKLKHVLLIDDVITTGSTLEAACHPLVQAGAEVSIATIGHVS
ncbi:ComF family protein [Prolixibacteraceae bacterium JC049]|nr:ComF family protein [Prolixibacteraceae bacterium JC049]